MRLLFVEDEPIFAHQVKRRLARESCAVDLAHHRRAARDLAIETEYDLIVLSLTLPDGVELPARSLGPDYDVPVVTIHSLRGTAEDEEGTPEQAEEGGIEVDDL